MNERSEFNLLSLKYLRVLINPELHEQSIWLLVNNMHSVNLWRTGNEHERHDRRLSQSWTYEQSAHAHFSIWQNFSCVHRGLMLPWKVHQIGLKAIFKEPIFTAVDGKSPVCRSTNITVHVHFRSTLQRQLSCQPCWRYSIDNWQYTITFYLPQDSSFCWTELK